VKNFAPRRNLENGGILNVGFRNSSVCSDQTLLSVCLSKHWFLLAYTHAAIKSRKFRLTFKYCLAS